MEIITWLTTTPLGLGATLGALFILFILIAVIYELRTRRLFPDTNRRGKKAEREGLEDDDGDED
ncbi:MAG TPA: hypothetical protein DEB24_07740 [Coriobacteriia bacterium]|nr:hypothetical protein [Coriobacteriia bacterium]